jgi:GH15 family glucan-1,4-alpha-glucosidase
VPALSGTLADRDARHAVAVLCGLTGPDGAMVAAATTSLPERSGGSRDYDYRYAWIRDQCYVGQAGAVAGAESLVDAAVRFVGARLREDGAKLRPAYCVDGAPVPDQRELDIAGYPGAPLTVVGNRAGQQFQLDVFGEALLLFAAAERRDRLDGDGWKAALAAVEAIERRWQEPDAGVWETDPVRKFAHSRLICAAGLRAVAAVATPGKQTAHWSSLADTLVAEVSSTCLHPTGRWQRAPDDDRCDAALLTAQTRGLISPEDPRSVATRAAVCEDLVQDGYVYRYRVEDRPLGTDEGAFMLCGYWLAVALHQAGDVTTARAHFERTRAGCGPAGLFTEEYDVEERQMRGNFPQAFVHAAMLEASVQLAAEP